jgi:hypothetical protein
LREQGATFQVASKVNCPRAADGTSDLERVWELVESISRFPVIYGNPPGWFDFIACSSAHRRPFVPGTNDRSLLYTSAESGSARANATRRFETFMSKCLALMVHRVGQASSRHVLTKASKPTASFVGYTQCRCTTFSFNPKPTLQKIARDRNCLILTPLECMQCNARENFWLTQTLRARQSVCCGWRWP